VASVLGWSLDLFDLFRICRSRPVPVIASRSGIFVRGVVASTHTIGTEWASPNWRGAMSGLVDDGGAGIGALLASFVFLVMSSIFPSDAFAVWGWRCMFFA
jgi:MHS family proline/betaine transporter-like MFS transporter